MSELENNYYLKKIFFGKMFMTGKMIVIGKMVIGKMVIEKMVIGKMVIGKMVIGKMAVAWDVADAIAEAVADVLRKNIVYQMIDLRKNQNDLVHLNLLPLLHHHFHSFHHHIPLEVLVLLLQENPV